MREMTLQQQLRRWADARERRNTPGGHGSTGTALLRQAASELDDAERMIAAMVWAQPSKSVTLHPIHLTADLELHRQDDTLEKSVRFFAEERGVAGDDGSFTAALPTTPVSRMSGRVRVTFNTATRPSMGHYRRALDDLRARGFKLPVHLRVVSVTAWRSALGQALAGGWGILHGQRSHWSASYGNGC